MTFLESINRIEIPSNIAFETLAALRRRGERGCEAFVLWAGACEDRYHATILDAIVPNQLASATSDGLCVIVDGDELDRINRYLYERRLSLIVQLHTHPTAAYHSTTDDEFPLVTTAGAVSIVVPNFAQSPELFRHSAVYRLANSGWTELAPDEISNLMSIV